MNSVYELASWLTALAVGTGVMRSFGESCLPLERSTVLMLDIDGQFKSTVT